MSKAVTHIIHKLNLEVEVPDERLARKMYQQAGDILLQYVLPKLEEMLRQYENPGVHIRLDKLDINLEALNTASFEDAIKTQLAASIVKELESIMKNQTDNPEEIAEARIGTGEDRIVEAFLWFLEKGTLPWWISDNIDIASSKRIIDAINVSEKKFINLFISILKNNPVVRERLLLQYDAPLLTYLFSLIVPLEVFSIAADYEQRIIKAFDKAKPTHELILSYWQMVWSLLPANELLNMDQQDMKRLLEKRISSFTQKPDRDRGRGLRLRPDNEEVYYPENDEVENEDIAKKRKTIEDPEYDDVKEGLLGSNAGLVLLHPFLQYFFMELGLTQDDQFKDEDSRSIAVHTLHYLATGKENVPDFDLVFEKYLCGMPSDQITWRYTKLNDKIKTEANALLQSVIKHWSVLKNTSIEGLREGFLQRKGKLVITESSHRIIMEHNTLDILLQQIPWNISLIKLPWCKQLLHVAWQS